jgi:hypothetical protein
LITGTKKNWFFDVKSWIEPSDKESFKKRLKSDKILKKCFNWDQIDETNPDLFFTVYPSNLQNEIRGFSKSQCCGSGMIIPDPGSKNTNKREG